MQNRKHLSCRLEWAPQQQGVLCSLHLAPFVCVILFGAWDTDLGRWHLFLTLQIALCVSNKLSESQTGPLYVYQLSQSGFGLGLALSYMCVQPTFSNRRKCTDSCNWKQGPVEHDQFKWNDHNAVFLLILDSVFLSGFAIRLASSRDGPWNDQVHKILRTNYPV